MRSDSSSSNQYLSRSLLTILVVLMSLLLGLCVCFLIEPEGSSSRNSPFGGFRKTSGKKYFSSCLKRQTHMKMGADA